MEQTIWYNCENMKTKNLSIFFMEKHLTLSVLNDIINLARVAQLVEHCYFRTSQAPKTIQIHCNYIAIKVAVDSECMQSCWLKPVTKGKGQESESPHERYSSLRIDNELFLYLKN